MTTPEPQGGGMSQTPPTYSQPLGQQFAPYPGAPAPQKRAGGLAVSALVVGIAAFVFGWAPVFGAIVGIVAIVLGVLALRKQQSKGMAITGLVLGAVAALTSASLTAGIGAAVNSASDSAKESSVVVESPSPQPSESESESESAEPAAEAEEPSEEPSSEPSEVAAAPDVPVENLSALAKAQSYSEIMHMSKAGIYDQLTSEYGEQFEPGAAQYAIDNVKADWNANALAKAKDYQESMSMSPAAIHDQLTSEYGEQFLPSEADYAIAHLND
jgi:hypothetical protein